MTQEAFSGSERPKRVLTEILENKRIENSVFFPELSNRFIETFIDANWPIVIAELKPKSPSQGKLFEGDPSQLLRIFVQGGAGGISVLTDKKYFDGSPELFSRIRQQTDLPMLWKDFVIHPGQILKASEYEADAVLLIVTALNKEHVCLKEMIDLAKVLNVAPVVEVYDTDEMYQALAAGAQIIGVNSRNLDTLEENLEQAMEVLARIPKDRIALLFSSVKSKSDVEIAHRSGANGVLVGTSILKASDPLQKLRELTSI